MTDLNTDHLSQRERYLMSMVYSAFLGYTKDQDHAARQVNYIVKSADELEPATTPQPSADAVRELVKRWRECAKSAANGPMFDGESEYAVAGTYIACADELESLISAASGEGVGK